MEKRSYDLVKFKRAPSNSAVSFRSEGVRLKRLGKILHLSKSRSLIAKLASEPTIDVGSKVLDNRLREVGVIQDVFGPVSSPYVAIKPTILDPDHLVGRVVYVAS